MLEDKAGKLSERLYRQGEAMAKTLYQLSKLYPNEAYSVLHSKNFADGGVIIQGMAGNLHTTKVK